MPQSLDEPAEPGRREPRRLSGRERTEDERSDDEGEHAAGVLVGELAVRTLSNRRDLRVDEAAHLREEGWISNRLREHPHPALGSNEVGAVVELQRAVDVCKELVLVDLVASNAFSKSRDQVLDEAAHELRLALEVVMDEAGRHSSLRSDRRNSGTRIAVVGESSCKGREQLSAPFFAIAGSSHRLVG